MEKNEKLNPDETRPDLLTRISEDFICEILSRASPSDASRFAVISKTFHSAAESDIVWGRFLPNDYQEILSKSVSPIVYRSKKELYFSLCDSPILLDAGQLSFSLDKKSGKKCFMVGARKLMIAWGNGDTPEYWDFSSDADSRFQEVANLKSVWWLDVRCKLNSQMLSQKSIYGAYLVFKVADNAHGLDYVNVVVRFVNNESDSDAEERGSTVHLHQTQVMHRSRPRRQPGKFPVRRSDGWMEIEFGDFYNDSGDDGEVEARLMEITSLTWKSGLCVQGIEFRPKARSG